MVADRREPLGEGQERGARIGRLRGEGGERQRNGEGGAQPRADEHHGADGDQIEQRPDEAPGGAEGRGQAVDRPGQRNDEQLAVGEGHVLGQGKEQQRQQCQGQRRPAAGGGGAQPQDGAGGDRQREEREDADAKEAQPLVVVAGVRQVGHDLRPALVGEQRPQQVELVGAVAIGAGGAADEKAGRPQDQQRRREARGQLQRGIAPAHALAEQALGAGGEPQRHHHGQQIGVDAGGQRHEQRPGPARRRVAAHREPKRGEDGPVARQRQVHLDAEHVGRGDQREAGGDEGEDAAGAELARDEPGEQRLQREAAEQPDAPILHRMRQPGRQQLGRQRQQRQPVDEADGIGELEAEPRVEAGRHAPWRLAEEHPAQRVHGAIGEIEPADIGGDEGGPADENEEADQAEGDCRQRAGDVTLLVGHEYSAGLTQA